MSIDTSNARKHLEQEVKQLQKQFKAENKALAIGLRYAFLEANIKKGTGTPPKAGSKRANNGDWITGSAHKVVYKWWDKSGKRFAEHEISSDNWEKELKNRFKTPTHKKNKKTGRMTKEVWQKAKRIIPVRVGNQKKPGTIEPRAMYRKGSTGSLPYSWGGKGLSNYYLRKQWYYKLLDDYSSEVRISPAKFKGEINNDRVLKLLDEGGTTKGSRRLGGYRLVLFPQEDRTLQVGIIKWYKQERPVVTMKPFHIKDKTLARINRVLRRGVRPSTITKEHWKKLGRG